MPPIRYLERYRHALRPPTVPPGTPVPDAKPHMPTPPQAPRPAPLLSPQPAPGGGFILPPRPPAAHRPAPTPLNTPAPPAAAAAAAAVGTSLLSPSRRLLPTAISCSPPTGNDPATDELLASLMRDAAAARSPAAAAAAARTPGPTPALVPPTSTIYTAEDSWQRHRAFFCICPDDCNSMAVYYLGSHDPAAAAFDLAGALGPHPVDLGDIYYAPQALVDPQVRVWIAVGWNEGVQPSKAACARLVTIVRRPWGAAAAPAGISVDTLLRRMSGEQRAAGWDMQSLDVGAKYRAPPLLAAWNPGQLRWAPSPSMLVPASGPGCQLLFRLAAPCLPLPPARAAPCCGAGCRRSPARLAPTTTPAASQCRASCTCRWAGAGGWGRARRRVPQCCVIEADLVAEENTCGIASLYAVIPRPVSAGKTNRISRCAVGAGRAHWAGGLRWQRVTLCLALPSHGRRPLWSSDRETGATRAKLYCCCPCPFCHTVLQYAGRCQE